MPRCRRRRMTHRPVAPARRVVGAIGIEKGYEYLLACARHVAAQRLALEFVVVGHTCDDKRLLDTGAVQITGNYEEAEAVELIRAQQAELGFLPALWPETWSYTLSQMWQAGLEVVAFDLAPRPNGFARRPRQPAAARAAARRGLPGAAGLQGRPGAATAGIVARGRRGRIFSNRDRSVRVTRGAVAGRPAATPGDAAAAMHHIASHDISG